MYLSSVKILCVYTVYTLYSWLIFVIVNFLFLKYLRKICFYRSEKLSWNIEYLIVLTIQWGFRAITDIDMITAPRHILWRWNQWQIHEIRELCNSLAHSFLSKRTFDSVRCTYKTLLSMMHSQRRLWYFWSKYRWIFIYMITVPHILWRWNERHIQELMELYGSLTCSFLIQIYIQYWLMCILSAASGCCQPL